MGFILSVRKLRAKFAFAMVFRGKWTFEVVKSRKTSKVGAYCHFYKLGPLSWWLRGGRVGGFGGVRLRICDYD